MLGRAEELGWAELGCWAGAWVACPELGLGWAGLGWAGPGRAGPGLGRAGPGLGWAGLGWAGLGWAGLAGLWPGGWASGRRVARLGLGYPETEIGLIENEAEMGLFENGKRLYPLKK